MARDTTRGGTPAGTAVCGRQQLLSRVDGLLQPNPERNVVVLHGPVGLGKTALLDAVAELATRRGLHVVRSSAHHGPLLGVLQGTLDRVVPGCQNVVLVDEVHWGHPIACDERDVLLGAVPQDTVIVLASRRAPTVDWVSSTWWSLVLELELEPLEDMAATVVLRNHGVEDPSELAALVEWAAGSPLALVRGAVHRVTTPGWQCRREPLAVWADADLLARVHADEGAPPAGLLELAAVAGSVTPALVASVLPGLDTTAAVRWLATRSYVTNCGGGIALQAAVRAAAQVWLNREQPELVRTLRRQTVDHLHARAVAGATRCTIDLAMLAEDAALRSAYGCAEDGRYRIDGVRSGDAEAVASELWSRGLGSWWGRTSPLFENAREWITVVRDRDGEIRGFAIAASPLRPPPGAAEDPVLGPWLEHARRTGAVDAVVCRDSFELGRRPGCSPVRPILNTGVILRSGLDNPRSVYLPILDSESLARGFAERIGAREVAELHVDLGGDRLLCFVVEYGPGGLLGAQRDFVYRELDLEPPERRRISAEMVREAMRCFDDPVRLSASPLAEGSTTEQRAAAARALLLRAWTTAFGGSDRQRFLAEVVRHAYFEKAASHEATAHDLGLPRQTYFRSLRLGIQAMAEVLSEQAGVELGGGGTRCPGLPPPAASAGR